MRGIYGNENRREALSNLEVEKNCCARYKDPTGIICMIGKAMKCRASVKADPSKGDKLVRRRGRLYIINKKDPNRKQRQKGPSLKK